MKYFLTLLFVLAITVSTEEYQVETKVGLYEMNQSGSITDVINCILDSKAEIETLIDLGKAIAEERFFDVARDVIKIINNTISVLEDCGSLFCYGPSYKKCEAETGKDCEMWGAIVYPECDTGYTNWDCCVCGTECPSGFRDDGLYCAKPAAYGRGAGYALWDQEKCEQDNPELGCEQNGALYYPKCQEGFHNVGCCICSPDCPEGWTDIGVSCQKPSTYGRGVGYPVSFGLQCVFQHVEEQLEELVAVSDDELPQFCVENRLNISQLSDDSQTKLDAVSDDIKEHLLPQEIIDLIQQVTIYTQIGCLDVDQPKPEEQQERLVKTD